MPAALFRFWPPVIVPCDHELVPIIAFSSFAEASPIEVRRHAHDPRERCAKMTLTAKPEEDTYFGNGFIATRQKSLSHRHA